MSIQDVAGANESVSAPVPDEARTVQACRGLTDAFLSRHEETEADREAAETWERRYGGTDDAAA